MNRKSLQQLAYGMFFLAQRVGRLLCAIEGQGNYCGTNVVRSSGRWSWNGNLEEKSLAKPQRTQSKALALTTRPSWFSAEPQIIFLLCALRGFAREKKHRAHPPTEVPFLHRRSMAFSGRRSDAESQTRTGALPLWPSARDSSAAAAGSVREFGARHAANRLRREFGCP